MAGQQHLGEPFQQPAINRIGKVEDQGQRTGMSRSMRIDVKSLVLRQPGIGRQTISDEIGTKDDELA
ncbi:hypothetical protein GOSPT_103_00160 [Gordonia sputi NBRC 100414]|uniref:Uncharacterized protein n=1 Tax=Gordonia sputi NBRC 100414 TaxID=1089453 RepID=H5U3Y1_9ACTN|nr:hypothetical protein GOSPT_103_00160 [Gordonia sputi NBRC 100414]